MERKTSRVVLFKRLVIILMFIAIIFTVRLGTAVTDSRNSRNKFFAFFTRMKLSQTNHSLDGRKNEPTADKHFESIGSPPPVTSLSRSSATETLSSLTRTANMTTKELYALYDFVKKNHLIPPYTPVDKAIMRADLSLAPDICEDLIRSGVGTEHFVTEKGEEILKENGIEYRRYPYLEPKSNPFFTSEYEAYIPFDSSTFYLGRSDRASPEKKIILWWQHKIHHGKILGLEPMRACPDFPCVVTTNRNYTNESAAILVNGQFVKRENPPRRRPEQVLIHYQIESPTSAYWFYGNFMTSNSGWDHIFNWTMSYRFDSDILSLHGLVRLRPEPRSRDYHAVLSQKKGKVAWLVSNCNSLSKRSDYVKELQKYIQIDIYGKCGKFACKRVDDKHCLEKLRKEYKFYLAFENSNCRDYMTEKLYRFLEDDVVVIARGDNSFYRQIPRELFLNTADFKSPKELADRLLYLDSHDEEYISMLKEKGKYISIYEDWPLTNISPVFTEYRYEAVPMCELCHRLWNLDKYAKTIPSMNAWFQDSRYQCHDLSDLP